MTERPMPSNTIFACVRTRFPIMHLPDWPSTRLYAIIADRCPLPSWSIRLRGLDGRALGTRGRAGSEAVAELAGDGLEVAHTAGTGGLPSLGLLAPVDC